MPLRRQVALILVSAVLTGPVAQSAGAAEANPVPNVPPEASKRPPALPLARKVLETFEAPELDLHQILSGTTPQIKALRGLIEAHAMLAHLERTAPSASQTQAEGFARGLRRLGMEMPQNEGAFQATRARLNALAISSAPKLDDFMNRNGVLNTRALDRATARWEAEVIAANAAYQSFDAALADWRHRTRHADALTRARKAAGVEVAREVLLELAAPEAEAGRVSDAALASFMGWLGVGVTAEGLIDAFERAPAP